MIFMMSMSKFLSEHIKIFNHPLMMPLQLVQNNIIIVCRNLWKEPYELCFTTCARQYHYSDVETFGKNHMN